MHTHHSRDRVDWSDVPKLLNSWHSERDRLVLGQILRFVEAELRAKGRAIVRGQLYERHFEDALQRLLCLLMRKPLREEVRHPEKYLSNKLRWLCLDERRRAKDGRHTSLTADHVDADRMSPQPQAADAVLQTRSQTEALRSALRQLKTQDRVAILLVAAPQELTEPDLRWLASRCGLSVSATERAAIQAGDAYTCSLLFDPGDDDPDDLMLRRKRLERFRRRRGRARAALNAITDDKEEGGHV